MHNPSASALLYSDAGRAVFGQVFGPRLRPGVAANDAAEVVQVTRSFAQSGFTGYLTGPITSLGGRTAVASQTGTGSKFVMDTSPTLVTPNIGTPSAGVVTNLTGTASININGTVGATTRSTGAFTTVDANATAAGSHIFGTPAAARAVRIVNIGGSQYPDVAVVTSAVAGAAGGTTFYFDNTTANYAWLTTDNAARTIGLGTSGATRLLASDAGIAITGNLSATTTIKTGGYTVATLPAGTVGMRAYVTDALAPAYGALLVGGGAITVPVFYNGGAWVSA